ncbi:MAG: hypothetical protein H0U42_10830 [Thermoleophilaceae bacterium]|nr:hypothetical protein [Thermoleophilaceae bacterium]
MNEFHILGGLLAIWAVLVSVMGIVRHDFPRSPMVARALMGFSALLVVGAIGSAITTASVESAEREEEEIQAAEGEPGE